MKINSLFNYMLILKCNWIIFAFFFLSKIIYHRLGDVRIPLKLGCPLVTCFEMSSLGSSGVQSYC